MEEQLAQVCRRDKKSVKDYRRTTSGAGVLQHRHRNGDPKE